MFHIFPGPFVFSTEVKNHKNIKDEYLPKILRDLEDNKSKYMVPNWNCKVYSTYDNIIDIHFDEDFTEEVIWNPLDECFENIEFLNSPKDSIITQFWYNYYEDGFFQEVHTHGTSSFSGIYILSLEEKNTTIFKNVNQPIYFNSIYKTEHLKEGTVIIFPSSLNHYVNPVKGNKITISFNIKTHF
jgi:hypothetical protein